MDQTDRIQVLNRGRMSVDVWTAKAMYSSKMYWGNSCTTTQVLSTKFVECPTYGHISHENLHWLALAIATAPTSTLLEWYPLSKDVHLLLKGIYREAYLEMDGGRTSDKDLPISASTAAKLGLPGLHRSSL